jgi:hypothetical protein
MNTPQPSARPVQLSITLKVAAPFNTAAAEPGALGVDAPLLRNHQGRPTIPGSLLQGRLVEEIGNWGADNFRALVDCQGSAASSDTNNQPLRKRLVLGDLVLQSDDANTEPTQLITRIALDANTRSVETGALQTLETPAASGAELKFVGKAHTFVSGDQDAQALRQQLQAALRLMPNVGAERSIGFGQVLAVDVSLDNTPDAAHPALQWPGQATAIDFALQFDRPLVVTDAPLSANGFDAAEVVAGNVLKGVFVDTCAALKLTPPPGLENIVFRHAFCASGNDRPRVNPASLVEADFPSGKPLIDLATVNGPVLLLKDKALSAPRFALDWKYDDEAALQREAQLAKTFGRASPGRQLRVRTAIDPDTRAAQDSQLFAYEALVHETTAKSRHTWRSRIDLSALKPEDQAKARETLTTVLQHGLYFLGKTKAIARAEAISPTTAESITAPALQTGQTVLLTLQTPALLTAASALKPGASAQDLRETYRAYFEEASGKALTLSHFYARQKLRGGAYQRQRFQGGPSAVYQPWLLTDAGAVFALTVKDSAKAQATLNQWLARGLPLADGWSPDWSKNPYQSANGFGEIALNQACHQQWAPEKQGVSCRPIAAAADPTVATTV